MMGVELLIRTWDRSMSTPWNICYTEITGCVHVFLELLDKRSRVTGLVVLYVEGSLSNSVCGKSCCCYVALFTWYYLFTIKILLLIVLLMGLTSSHCCVLYVPTASSN